MSVQDVENITDENLESSKDVLEVSVIIPTYNAEQFISQTMVSILAQQDVKLELLVVDDCSTDNTVRLISDFVTKDPRVRYFSMPSNSGGPVGPRNYGISKARGKWIAFCDADDLWHPSKLRLQLDMAAQEVAALVCCIVKEFSDNQIPILMKQPLAMKLPIRHLNQWQLLLKNQIATSSVLCRRDLFKANDGFETMSDLIAVEDYDLWLRLLEIPKFSAIQIRQPLIAYRVVSNSLSADKLNQLVKVRRVIVRAATRRGIIWAIPLLVTANFIVNGVIWIVRLVQRRFR